MDNVRKFCMVTTSQGLSTILEGAQEENAQFTNQLSQEEN